MDTNSNQARRVVIGITAHVDAGKTTLAEAMLYRTGRLRKLGRVDHGSAAMDSHLLERERGITIFSSQAELPVGNLEVTLLDTPGHVDFSAEMERTLSVLDYAILVISGADGVQAHTRTLWRLLELYRIPTFLFVTKMDFGRCGRGQMMEHLRHELGEGCVDFTPADRERRMEQLATYRAVRQGLMQAKSRLLEPYYAFRLEVPPDQLGRAINDVRLRSGSFDTPEEAGDLTLLRGRVPVTEFDDYAQEVASYTGGRGRLSLEPAGYGPCHNPEAVIAAADYDPEADPDNTPDSVFCAHGGGFTVKWDKVPEYMHLPGCLEKPREDAPVRRRCIRLDDAELEAIMTREFGPVRRPLYRVPEKRNAPADTGLREIGQRCYVVDGYNVIFDWEELHALADRDLSAARERLMDTLCGWAAFTHTRVVLVFDGYKVPGNTGEKFDYRGIHVVYTRERETGDMYIERFLQQVGKNDHVRVVTSDGLIQLSAVRTGAMRMSSAEFGRQVSEAAGQIAEILKTMHQSGGSTIGQRINKS